MEVMPVFAHPVENTLFLFRSGDGAARRTYAHLADISSFSVLAQMAEQGANGPALSRRTLDSLLDLMRAPADVKKVDAGGGFIHGDALDFASDSSTRLRLSHGITAVPPWVAGHASIAAFAEVDVLIADGAEVYLRGVARRSLAAWFPGIPAAGIQELALCPIVDVPAGTLIHRSNDADSEARLILSGIAEIDSGDGESGG